MDISEISAAQVEAIAALVLRAGDQVDAPVPACPEWHVRDVVAHMAELAHDAATGDLPVMDLMEQWRDDGVVVARDAMTADQVARHPDRPVDEVIEEWRSLAASLAPMLTGAAPFPEPAPFGLAVILVTDVAVHDQDLRGALGAPRPGTVRPTPSRSAPTASPSTTASTRAGSRPWAWCSTDRSGCSARAIPRPP